MIGTLILYVLDDRPMAAVIEMDGKPVRAWWHGSLDALPVHLTRVRWKGKAKPSTVAKDVAKRWNLVERA